MQKMSIAVKNEVVEYVAESFVNIVQTLFILRKWDSCPDEKSIESIISCYLHGCEDSFWKMFIGDDAKVKKEKSSSDISIEIVRHMTVSINLRKKTHRDILGMFISLDNFLRFMEKKEPELKCQKQNSRKKGLKTAKATVFTRSIRGNSEAVSVGGVRKNNGGPAKIGPPTRSYSSGLTKKRVKDRMLYWSEHKDDLYSG